MKKALAMAKLTLAVTLLAVLAGVLYVFWRWLQQPDADKFDVANVGRFWKPTDEEHEYYRGVFTEPVGKVHGPETALDQNGGSYGNVH